jgi:hypothetical protein
MNLSCNARVVSPAARLVVLAVVFLLPTAASADDSGRIKPYTENPRYWQYKGEPVLLLGGSKTDHIFLLDDLETHLDEIAGVGGNYVRNTMSQREGADLKPHKRLPDGTFDLNQWNEDYWRRFANCLKWCRERDVIIQIEVWDRFDYSQEQWVTSPWRPANNVNYTPAESGLANQYPIPPWKDQQPFFHTVPGMRDYRKELDLIRGFQEEFVARMLSYSLDFDNVLYCMNNETSTAPKWGLYWMDFIRRKAAEKGVQVCVTDMFDDGWKPASSAKIRQALDRPEQYTFIDISQVNSRTFNEDHWNNIVWVVDQLAETPRPLNNTKIYSDGQTSWGSGTPKDGVERFWRNLIAGAASCRFHRPEAGIGLNDTAKACIQAARKLESQVKFWDVSAHQELLSEREPDEAYLAAQPGERYVLYFTDGGALQLDLSGHQATFGVKWVNISTGDWGDEGSVRGGGKVSVAAPGAGGWVAALVLR